MKHNYFLQPFIHNPLHSSTIEVFSQLLKFGRRQQFEVEPDLPSYILTHTEFVFRISYHW